ncbi:MAG: hypothetical protein R3F34_11180 [Planctomycetota bacterium]
MLHFFEKQSGGGWLETTTYDSNPTGAPSGSLSIGESLALDAGVLTACFFAGAGDEIPGIHTFERQLSGVWDESATFATFYAKGLGATSYDAPAMALEDGILVCASGRTDGDDHGLAASFERIDAVTWSPRGQAHDPDAEFGFEDVRAVAVSNGHLVAAGTATGVHGLGWVGLAVLDAQPDGTWSTPRRLVLEEQLGTPQWSTKTGDLPIVDVDGDRIVASRYESSLVNGSTKGVVHVFDRQPTGDWLETARIEDPLPYDGVAANGHAFGAVLALDGDRLAIGDWRAGRVFVHERDPSGDWPRTATIDAPPSGSGLASSFGKALDLDGSRLVVGTAAWSIVPQPGEGAVVAYEFSTGSGWVRTHTILPGDVVWPSPYGGALEVGALGASVALEGTRVLVGATDTMSSIDKVPIGAAFVLELGPSGGVDTIGAAFGHQGYQEHLGGVVALAGGRAIVAAESLTDDLALTNTSTYVYDVESDGSLTPIARVPRIGLDPYVSGAPVPARVAADADHLVVFDEAYDWFTLQDPGVRAYGLGTLFQGQRRLFVDVGGIDDLYLRAGSGHGGDIYFVLGSITGTSPGIPVPGTSLVLPLAYDIYTNYLQLTNGGVLVQPYAGVLDVHGRADAKFFLYKDWFLPFAGFQVHHAFLVWDPETATVTHVSNPLSVGLELFD